MHALQLIDAAPARAASITTLGISDLEYVDNYKYLGVWLDCKLSFQTQIKHLQSKKSLLGKALPYLTVHHSSTHP